MKKIFLISIIGFLMFAGCMVNPADYTTRLESKTLNVETTPEQEEDEPASEVPQIEMQPTQLTSLQVVFEEPEDTESSSEIEEQKVVDWVAFYNRVLQKGREKYNKKLPWSSIAKDAGLKLGSWMVDAGSCNRKPPKEEEIRKIADVLDTSYEWLLYGED